MKIDLNTVLELAPGVYGRIIGSDFAGDQEHHEQNREAVLVIPSKGQVKVLNDVAAFIWSLVNGNRSIAEMLQMVCDEYDVEEKQAQRDIIEFAMDLVERGLLIIVNR